MPVRYFLVKHKEKWWNKGKGVAENAKCVGPRQKAKAKSLASTHSKMQNWKKQL